ncbi:MAG TPA: carbon monoxide dehydrogenase subunit G [Gammaproteobacteria bacterium]|nr:carbon monoxide dehydrogenase subunit G [Gammaproteobacteria bacterium]
MEMQSQRQLPRPPGEVWDALNDPDVLRACVPGCESLDEIEDGKFEALVRAKVGPVKARFRGHVSVVDPDPPNGYVLRFEGQGGAAGFAKGEASVRLSEGEEGEGCTLTYDASAQVGGKLAQVGSRLVQGAARKMADEFFDNLVTHLGGGSAPAPEEGDDQPAEGEGRGWKFWKKKDG